MDLKLLGWWTCYERLIHLSLCLYISITLLSFFTLPLFISESVPFFYLCVSLRVFFSLNFTQGSLSHKVFQSLFLSVSFSLTLRLSLSLCFSHSHNLSPDQSLFLFLPISHIDFLRVSAWLSLCAYVSLILGISLSQSISWSVSLLRSPTHTVSLFPYMHVILSHTNTNILRVSLSLSLKISFSQSKYLSVPPSSHALS